MNLVHDMLRYYDTCYWLLRFRLRVRHELLLAQPAQESQSIPSTLYENNYIKENGKVKI